MPYSAADPVTSTAAPEAWDDRASRSVEVICTLTRTASDTVSHSNGYRLARWMTASGRTARTSSRTAGPSRRSTAEATASAPAARAAVRTCGPTNPRAPVTSRRIRPSSAVSRLPSRPDDAREAPRAGADLPGQEPPAEVVALRSDGR